MTGFILNDKEVYPALPPGTTLLDFIRYQQQLTGTKIGCREGDCGACTILAGEIKNGRLQYSSATSCLMPLGNARNKHIVTIEGINLTRELSMVQQAFMDEAATQCGFCTPGFIVSLTGHCMAEKESCYETAIDAMNGNICRCTGYKSIERAAMLVNEKLQEKKSGEALAFAVENKIVPSYFLHIKSRLQHLIEKNNAITEVKAAAKFLGGGTDLYVQQHETVVNDQLDFLLNRPELQSITREGNICEMGGAVTVTAIGESAIFQQHFNGLQRYIKLVSSTQIRNMATIAGNFTNASPIGDFTIFFLALNAQLILTDGTNWREIPLRKFYKGYKSLDKLPGEWIEKISFPLPAASDHFNFEKVCKRSYLDIASVNTAIFLQMGHGIIVSAGLAAGGVGPVPAYLQQSSEWLAGKRMEEIQFSELIGIVQTEISPISDVRGTASYKRLLLTQLIKAHFTALFPALTT